MEDSPSLDSALGDTPEEPTTIVDEVSQEETPEETTSEAETSNEEETPEGSTPEPEESWTKTMALDERSKRQIAQQELTEANLKLARYEGYQQGQQPTVPELTNEEQTDQFWSDPVGVMKQFVGVMGQKFTEQQTQQQQANDNRFYQQSEIHASRSHDDFAEVKAHFLEMAKVDRNVAQPLKGSADPWGDAYDIAKKDMEFKSMGNLDDYKAKLKAEVMEEVRAELKASGTSMASIPESLVTAPSKGPVKGSNWSGPPTLESIIGN